MLRIRPFNVNLNHLSSILEYFLICELSICDLIVDWFIFYRFLDLIHVAADRGLLKIMEEEFAGPPMNVSVC